MFSQVPCRFELRSRLPCQQRPKKRQKNLEHCIAGADSLLRFPFSLDQPHAHNDPIRYYVRRFPALRRLVLSLADKLRLDSLGAGNLYGVRTRKAVSMNWTGRAGVTCLVRVVQALYVVVQWRSALGGDVGLCVALKVGRVSCLHETDYVSTHLLKLLPVRETAWYAYPVSDSSGLRRHFIPRTLKRTSVEAKARLELVLAIGLHRTHLVTYRHCGCCER